MTARSAKPPTDFYTLPGLIVLIIVSLIGCSNPLSEVDYDPYPRAVTLSEAGLALQEAQSQLDKLYEWAGNGPDTYDCSGLIVWAYQQSIGQSRIFRWDNQWVDDITMDALYRFGTEPVGNNDIHPGDIVFITDSTDRISHGGLFIRWISDNDFEFINASSYFKSVTVDTWSIDTEKRDQWYVGAGRLLVPE